jgi:hypothetical protein
VGGAVLSVLQQFLDGRTQHIVLDSATSDPVRIVSGVSQGSVLGPLLFSLYTAELFRILENTLVGFADDSTLVAVVPSPVARLGVSASLNRDLGLILDWCSRWGIVLNSAKTKSMIVSRSCTVLPASPDLLTDDAVLLESKELPILGVCFDSRLMFGAHVRSVAATAAQKLGIMRKARRLFDDQALAVRCFWTYILPFLEYCSPVWGSTAQSHLCLLDRIVRGAAALTAGGVQCDLNHRRTVASVYMLHKILFNSSHILNPALPGRYVPMRSTRRTTGLHVNALAPIRCRTGQYGRSFVPRSVVNWNNLGGSVFAAGELSAFKSAVNRFLLQG